VVSVKPGDDAVEIGFRAGGVDERVRARHVVMATKAFNTASLVPSLPADTRSALEAIPYGPTVVMAVLTGETGPMPWDGMYALATPKRSFTMLFNMGNVVHSEPGHVRRGGSFMMYRSADAALELLEQPDEEIERRFLDDLAAIYPETRGLVRETRLLKLPRMLPYPVPGRAALQPALDRPLGRIHLAGDYLGGVYSDTSIASGQEAALAIRRATAR
jgi:oxygen-dependent protoporphyrinogen oxidase